MTVKDDLEIVSNHKKGRDGIIAILGTIQSKYGYLPEKILREVADETGQPATFEAAMPLQKNLSINLAFAQARQHRTRNLH